MPYIGTPVGLYEDSYQARTDHYSGDGSTNTFTLTYSINSTTDIEVVVNNVQQNPFTNAYSVSGGTTLTFTTPPPAGSNNVYVLYNSFSRVRNITYASAIITDYLAPLSVTTAKIAAQAVTTDKVANTITLGTVTLTGPAVSGNSFSINTRATSANHATQKQYVDALTIIFGA